jgi:hypothetical protein
MMSCLSFKILKTHRVQSSQRMQQRTSQNLVCVQKLCSVCEMQDDIKTDCVRCGRKRNSFFDDPVKDLLSYLRQARHWCNKVVTIVYNAKAFDSQFILK